ncbi:MAG: hypothetical protein MJ233_04740 [Mycoplasmoidaceae bacterium]|nr:hypothetical protein [Mycoplasmoidaceae bacterium]
MIPADKVTTYNITICLKSKTFDPYVTDEEMENAISLRDEEYVQTNEVAQTTTVTQTFRMVMSP